MVLSSVDTSATIYVTISPNAENEFYFDARSVLPISWQPTSPFPIGHSRSSGTKRLSLFLIHRPRWLGQWQVDVF